MDMGLSATVRPLQGLSSRLEFRPIGKRSVQSVERERQKGGRRERMLLSGSGSERLFYVRPGCGLTFPRYQTSPGDETALGLVL